MKSDSFAVTGRPVAVGQKLVLLGAVALVYASNFWPGREILRLGLKLLGNPEYAGFKGVFLPHLLLYSTLTALIAALLWLAFVRAGAVRGALFGGFVRTLPIGVAAGLVSLAVSLLVVWVAFPAGTIGWVDPQPWKIAGNLFSNFYEEFVFRGFILVALTAVLRFWPASILSSIMWAATHTQYPLSLQATIAIVGILFCWLVRQTKSVWPAYTGHMVLDIIGDSLIG
jgi:membrane protease YdiL (CAAX protease family)